MAHAAITGRDGGRGVSRRAMLLGGLAVVVAGGGGVTVGALQHLGSGEPGAPPPTEMVAALAAERQLIAGIDATTGGDASVRAALGHIRADHAAHQDALQAAVAAYRKPNPAGTSTAPAAALHLAQLRAAEQLAATRAAAWAATLAGRNAALLASIAACEASHVELLT